MMPAATVARWLAILIAILGVVDPAITSMRRTKPEIALVAPNRVDSSLARRVAERLEDDFTVLRGEYAAAAATVIVGNRMPKHMPTSRVFSVSEAAPISVTRLDVPDVATTEARMPVTVAWQTADLSRASRLELVADGVVVGRAESNGANSFNTFAELTVTPTRTGPLRLRARAIAGRDTAVADAVTDVADAPHPVLFFDRRPSWMSTFVRRAIEADRRFAVASRVMTSRGISTDAGRPPSTLADPTVLELYDVIVVGAPDMLTSGDVAGLEAFLRRRGGAVILLFDERPRGGVHERLVGAVRWTGATARVPNGVRVGDDSAALRVAESAWPAELPAASIIRAQAGAPPRPLIWSTMVGRGEVVVSGALDSWKYRDPAQSRFEDFWRTTIIRAAREAMDAVEVRVPENLLEPGDRVAFSVALRDTQADARAELRSAKMATPVRLWPGARRGELEGQLAAPMDTGDYRLVITAGGHRTEELVVVAPRVSRAAGNDGGAIRLLAETSGGAVVSPDQIGEVLRASVVGDRRRERGWPMRSGWWTVPFVLLLGFEWFARRRRSLS